MERGRYNGYRGRSTTQKVLMGLVSVLAALVVLMALVLLLGQRYIYYGADGVHLDLPFLQQDPAPAPDVGQVVVEILPPAPKPDLSEQEGADESAGEPVLPDSSADSAGNEQTE